MTGPVLPTFLAPSPPIIFSGASYATGGVALRNRQQGVMHVSGAVGPLQAAYLYFSYLFTSTPPATEKLSLHNLKTGAAGTVTGTLIGKGADPCWGSSGNAVYRAPVSLSIANSNGPYELTLTGAQSALNTGNDPWVRNVFPAAEGASIVIIGTGSYTVELYDTAIPSATEFTSGLSYTLKLPATASGASTLWDSIGADGQLGSSRTANSASGETTSINSVAVSGPGATNVNSDWDGSSGWPLPQLWDDTGHDITTSTPSGTTALNVSISVPSDCLVAIANVVAVR